MYPAPLRSMVTSHPQHHDGKHSVTSCLGTVLEIWMHDVEHAGGSYIVSRQEGRNERPYIHAWAFQPTGQTPRAIVIDPTI